MPGQSGADTPLWYLWEDNGFAASPSDSTLKAFGSNASLDVNEGSNNAVRVLAPDSKEAVDIIAQNFSGSFEVSFFMTNPWWLGGPFGDPSTSGSGPYTHAYSGTTLQTMRLVGGFRPTDNQRDLLGCLPAEITVTASTPERTLVTISGAYADESYTDGSSLPSQPSLSYRPLKFSESRLDLGGNKVAIVQEATLTISLNANLINALDSRTAVDYWSGVRELDVQFSKVKTSDEDSLQDFYGGSSATSPQDAVDNQQAMTFEFTSAVDTNTITLNLTGSLPNSYELSNFGNPSELLNEEVNRLVTGISADAVNDTSSAP